MRRETERYSVTGQLAGEGRMPNQTGKHGIRLKGKFKDMYGRLSAGTLILDDKDLQCGVALIGESRIGKTNVIQKISSEVYAALQPGEKMVILDVKGDYTECITGADVIRLGPSTNTCWNIFKDILAFGSSRKSIEMRASGVAEYMFKDHKSEAQPFFAYAAQLLFRCILVYFIRRAMEQGSDAGLNNRALHEFLMKLNPEKLRNMIDSYEDFGFARTFLPDRELTTDETLGILSELVVMDGRTFVKNFAEKGSFSPVDFIRRGSGVLILVCDQSEASVASPVFRYMMDMMYMALGAQDTKTGRVTFVQDEFATIPRLEKQPMALSLLKYRSAFICGFQDYSQLLSVYGRADAETIAGMYQSIIMMRCSGESVTYVQQRFGTAEVITEYVMPNGTTGQKIEVRPAIEQHEVNAMRIGDAFVKLPNDPPFYFHFNDYSVS